MKIMSSSTCTITSTSFNAIRFLFIILSYSVLQSGAFVSITPNGEERYIQDKYSYSIRQQTQSGSERQLQRRRRRRRQQGQEQGRCDPKISYTPNFFDRLRNELAANLTKGEVNYTSNDSTSNNKYELWKSESYGSSVLDFVERDTNSSCFRLVDLKFFWKFTELVNTTSNSNQLEIRRQDDALTVLLAIYHWNNINSDKVSPNPIRSSSVVPSFCNVKMTVELFDTKGDPIETTREFASLIQKTLRTKEIITNLQDDDNFVEEVRNPRDILDPFISAVIGPYRPEVTSLSGILTGIHGIPLFSPAALSNDLDFKDQYPFFGRTVPNSMTVATVAVQYFTNIIQSTHVAVLFVPDDYGSELSSNFIQHNLQSNSTLTIETIAVPYSATTTKERSVASALKALEFRHIFLILYETQLPSIAATLDGAGLLTNDYLYVLEGFDVFSSMERAIRTEKNSSLSKLLSRTQLLQTAGYVTNNPIVSGNGNKQRKGLNQSVVNASGDDVFSQGRTPDKVAMDFRVAREMMLQDSVFMKYVRSKLPASYDTDISDFNRTTFNDFVKDPGHYGSFIYDAVVGAGLSMCQLTTDIEGDNTDNYFFTGKDIYDQFRNLSFTGTSGQVTIDPETGSRVPSSVAFITWDINVIGVDDDGFAIIQFTPGYEFANNVWAPLQGMSRQFSTRNHTFHASLPPVDFNYNYIGRIPRATGFTLIGITMLSTIVSLAWLIYYRNYRIVQSSKTLALAMVSIGASIMAASILPRTFDESTHSEIESLNRACTAYPWLYFLGTATMCSALVAKIHGVFKAYRDPTIEFIFVSNWDILKAFSVAFGLNLLFLIAWTTVSPGKWTRVDGKATDTFNRPTESFGFCDSKYSDLFFWILVTGNALYVFVGLVWALISRNIITENDESFYIGVSFTAVLHALVVGLPILQAVKSNTSARFYVEIIIIFFTSQSMISLVYIPKMIALRRELRVKATLRVSMSEIRSADGLLTSSRAEKIDSQPCGESSAEEPVKGDKLSGPVVRFQESTIGGESEQHQDNRKSLLIARKAKSEPSHLGSDEKPARIMPSVGSLRRFMAASPEGNSKSDVYGNRGQRVLYHPRAPETLKTTGGYELSKIQFQYVSQQNLADPIEREQPEVSGGVILSEGICSMKDNVEEAKEEVSDFCVTKEGYLKTVARDLGEIGTIVEENDDSHSVVSGHGRLFTHSDHDDSAINENVKESLERNGDEDSDAMLTCEKKIG